MKTYKCFCGDYHYFEMWGDDQWGYFFDFIEEPKTLLEWFKRIFRKRSYLNEIVFSRKQLEEIHKEIGDLLTNKDSK